MTNKCKHEAKKLSFSKMFINDNGAFGGQSIEVLLECECDATLHVRQERGNFPEQHHRETSSIGRFSNAEYEQGAKTTVIP